MKVCYGLITHKHGVDVYLAETENGLFKKLRTYCDDYWDDEIGSRTFQSKPSSDLNDEDAVHMYFDLVESEFLDVEINVPVAD
jgi:hypothetical protein